MIDYFISLEPLYSKASELTEVTHRLATRVARALATNSLDEKKEMRDEIKKWYGVRRKIVHGIEVDLSKTASGLGSNSEEIYQVVHES